MYCTQENCGRQIWRILRYLPKFSLPLFTYTESVFGICTHCNLFANFFLANTSYLYGSPKFPLPKFSLVLYLYLNTSKSTCILLKYFSQNNAMYLYLYFNKCQSTCTLLKYFHMYFAPCLIGGTLVYMQDNLYQN